MLFELVGGVQLLYEFPLGFLQIVGGSYDIVAVPAVANHIVPAVLAALAAKDMGIAARRSECFSEISWHL